ncbi:hypothetical protein OG866_17420 [Streptomyces sp. NBC_00663]|uniref:hypothetical protein n=1 Tax=Streptomyces sp. NBC_00663 TaxID=2975801 RepID=UPI002E34ED68|nr:hypothetical protein [Streptomyces sp. NBC_00663]
MTTPRRPALRVALFGLTVTLVGYVLLGAWLAGNAYVRQRALDHDRAHSELAVGVVLEDADGVGAEVRVRWSDEAGHTRVQRFAPIDRTWAYPKDARFLVEFDPTEQNPTGHPYDWHEHRDGTPDTDGLVASAVVAGLVAVALCAAWARRGLAFRRAARRPGHPMTAEVRLGERAQTLPWRSANTLWLVLDDRHWQRVMWHPALEDRPGRFPVTVHGTRTAAVVLPDGTRLVPIRRLRHREPARTTFADLRTVRGDLRDSFIVPAGTLVRPAHVWWRQAWPATAFGAVLGVAAGFLTADGTLLAVGGHTLAFATLSTSAWALSAPQP